MSHDQEPTWRTQVQFLVLHPERPAILVRAGLESGGEDRARVESDEIDHQPVLPVAEAARFVWAPDSAWFVASLGELLGVEGLRMLRRAAREVDEETRNQELVMVAEWPSAGQAPAEGWSWVEAGAFDRLAPLDALGRQAVEAWLEEQTSGRVPVQRPPWARERSGWHREACEWIDGCLADRGVRRTGPVEQVKSWGISCVLRAPTEDGPVWFKASGEQPLFVDEAAFTLALARHLPRWAPEIMGARPGPGWLLMRDLGPPVYSREDMDEAHRERLKLELLAALPGFQASTAERLEIWREVGCPDRGLAVAIEQAHALLDDPLLAESLQAEEIERLRAVLPAIVEACQRLAAAGLPNVLVHGDLHPGNLALRGEDFVIFDWTDACIAHPMVDLLLIAFEEDDARRGRLQDAYAAGWAELRPEISIEPLWPLARVATELHQAVSYQHILHNLEPGRPELWGGLGQFARRLIEAAERLT